jgi:hypothetical protein
MVVPVARQGRDPHTAVVTTRGISAGSSAPAVRAPRGRSTAPDGPSGGDRAVQSEASKRARRVGACGCGSSARR